MKNTKTKVELIRMYIDSLNEGVIPWRKRWTNTSNINGITGSKYKGVNQLILNYTSYVRKYTDNRWYTFIQIKNKGWKLRNAKGEGVPIEFWSVYDKKNKVNISIDEYNRIIQNSPDEKENYRLFNKTTFVYNASLIEGVPQQIFKYNKIETSKYINSIIKKLGVKYVEGGDRAYYIPMMDQIVIPSKEKFFDTYSYYATQLHEICHSTGNVNRLNRNLLSNNEMDYAKEELVAEISSSFLMQRLNIDVKAEHYDNHKSYIQSWISILNDKPQDLFNAINESNKVCDYIDNKVKEKNRSYER